MLTGFTLTLDGDPEAIDRVLKAAFREMEAVWREDDAAAEPVWLGLPPRRYIVSGLRRISGRLDTRQTV